MTHKNSIRNNTNNNYTPVTASELIENFKIRVFLLNTFGNFSHRKLIYRTKEFFPQKLVQSDQFINNSYSD